MGERIVREERGEFERVVLRNIKEVFLRCFGNKDFIYWDLRIEFSWSVYRNFVEFYLGF